MKPKIDLKKTVYPLVDYPRIINTTFSELGTISINEQIDSTPTVNEFFNLYNELFYEIPSFGEDIGSGYKAGDQLTWSTAQIDALPGITSGGTDSVVTISTFDIQQLNVIATPDLYVALDNNAGVFYSESINDFRLNVRPEFPVRTFQTSSLYTTNFALPSASYYAIKDLDTNEFVIDFDKEFTQISCDPTSSYFTVYMNGLEPERYYNILIQTEIDGQTIVMDENYYFKVVNG